MLNEPVSVAMSSKTVAVQHVTITTTRSYDEVKASLEGRLGRLDDVARDMLKRGELDALRERLKGIAGEAGLAIHYVGPHGDWLALQGQRAQICNYLIGNVLYAVQMTGLHPGAGLYAPLRIVMYAGAGGGCVVEYDQPSTLFGQYGHPEIDKVAHILDDKLKALLLQVCHP
jgi:uncharacterized protein (DUF302 family)